MKCEQVVENVQDLLVDLPEPDVRREMEDHLRNCAECGRVLEKARKALAVLNEWQPEAPPARPRTTRRALLPLGPSPWKPALGAVAALLGIALLVVLARRPSPPVARTPEIEIQPTAPVSVPKTEALPPIKAAEPAPPQAVPLPPPQPSPVPEKPAPERVAPAPPPVEEPRKEEPAKTKPPAPARTTATVVARLERVKGEVFASGAPWETRRVQDGMELQPDERLFTRGAGSLVSVRVSDAVRLDLAGLTEIRYLGPDEVLLEQGKVDVDAGKDLACFTFNATAQVAEGRFTLERKGDTTLLDVQRGKVQFSNQVTGRLLQVKPGQNAKAEGHPKVDQRKVDAAVANGVRFLRGRLAGLKGGTDELELVLYTLLHGGVSEKDPDVQTLVKSLLALEPQKTYNTALRAMALEKIDRVRYQEEIWKCAQYFLDNQAANGQWGYGTPTTYGPIPKGVPTGTATGGRPKVVDFSDKMVRRRIPVTKKRDGAASDNSNSQYAALGLRACHDAGIDLPKDAIVLARKWLLDCQAKEEGGAGKDGVATGGIAAPPRGWSYTPDRMPYGSMTAGAIGSVCIYDYILDGEKSLSWKRDASVLSGIAWLAHNFSATGNPGVDKVAPGYSLVPDGAMYYYYLYAVERTGLLFGTEKFGAREWYPEGANVLLKAQQPDGSWPPTDTHRNAVWDTCFSILFLRRATRPLMDVASEDRKSK